MRRFSRIFAWTTPLFVAGAVLFFTKAAALPYKVAWPVLLLSLATFLSRRRELLPFGFAVAADIAVRYVRDGTKQPHPWASVMLWGMAAVLLGFGVWRNLRLS